MLVVPLGENFLVPLRENFSSQVAQSEGRDATAHSKGQMAQNSQNRKIFEIWNFGDPEILFWEGVISLYKFITKSVISGSKRPKSENSEICSCLLVLARARSCSACACSCSVCARSC